MDFLEANDKDDAQRIGAETLEAQRAKSLRKYTYDVESFLFDAGKKVSRSLTTSDIFIELATASRK